MRKINVLMFALEFPPVNSTGCYRYLKFLKHLDTYNIEATVLIPSLDDLKKLHPNAKVDFTLLDQIPKNIDVIEVPLSKRIIDIVIDAIPSVRMRNLIRLGDDNIAHQWKKQLIKAIDVLIPIIQPNIIWGTVPPFSLGKLMLSIASKHKIPLIVDFRDELSLNKNIPFSTYLHFLNAFHTEEAVFKNANGISVVTPQLLKIFQRIHPKVDSNKFHLITNGFDFEDFQMDRFESLPVNKNEKYIIGYSGSYYYDPYSNKLRSVSAFKRPGIKKFSYQQRFTKEDWTYRSPYFFLKALRVLFDRRPDLVQKIEFHHIGHSPIWLNDMVDQFNLSKNFVSYGFVTKAENLEIQKKFNLLLCTSEKLMNEEHYCLSSKVFDYIFLGKPILGFVTSGITKEFIERSGCGIICNPDNSIESSNRIEFLCENGGVFIPNKEFLLTFTSKSLTFQLRELFDKYASG